MTTLLQLVQQATGELGITVPTVIIGNNSTDAVQQLALINGVGNELQRGFSWQHQQIEYRFNTKFLTATGTTTTNSTIVTGLSSTVGLDSTYMVVGTGMNQDTYVSTRDSVSQVTLNQAASASGTVTLNFCKTQYAMPADYDRIINETQWDKTKHWKMIGPETAQQWQWLKSGFIATGPRIRFRILQGMLQIWPPTSTAEYIGFEYLSNGWVTTTNGTTLKSSFTVDTDTCVFPDRLMVCGLKNKYLEAKGFDTTATFRDYQTQLDIAKANDGGAQTLSMNPQLSQNIIGYGQIPDSNYGS